MGRFFGYVRTFENWPLHYLSRFGLLPDRKRLELRLRNGLKVLARARTGDMRTSRNIFIDEAYLPPPLSIPEDAVVIDIGGHIGCFTLFAAQRARRGRIFAYEPEPSNFELLSENVRRNAPDRARAFNLAVDGREGERQMHFSVSRSGTGGHSFFGPGERTFTVRCTTLPQILAEHRLDRVDFLKLDCEGAEVEILESLSDEQLVRIRQLAMEPHRPAELHACYERLDRLGFEELPSTYANYRYFRRPP
jgi:FkbM family methyltransferase